MKNDLVKGNILAISAYLIWGFMPLYWALLGAVSSVEIITHRIILSFVMMGLYLLILKRKDVFAVFKDTKTRWYVIAAGLALAVNWTSFIIAVLAGRVLESSLAYYINPLVVILLGMLFLKEAAGPYKITAVALATVGVLVLIFGYNRFPIYALLMAFSFSLYGLIKKKIQVDAFTGLFTEMAVLVPIAMGTQIFLVSKGITIYNGGITSGWFFLLFMLCGFLTMLPLVLYNSALHTISLGNSGFLQFIAPTIMLLIGVLIKGEPFTTVHLISFIFIWLAVAVYCVYLVRLAKKNKADAA